ncbi:RNase P subunit p29-like protein [Gloeophyllum trabeum ATCC 11539]|uniref:RNase P subunit p29-like protein n=1 Tax=Gloeophyllum trabeum (strain ATCC 11539 / FP-39264 / Madison 617) TaxID=670483 RepID=S7Q2W2_GLOTA|nr:RNase P subunit p29-like protein [Gloeophyllum trabeum ATCC 11539]EPQ53887.1 RNase P subunit p29-like protein [Gloeophyllum trabeum ATCC 11539]
MAPPSGQELVVLDVTAVASRSRTPNAPVNPYAPLANRRLTITSTAPFTPTYVQSHLTTSDPAGTYASRISGKQIMLENPAKESKAKKERDEKKARRKEAKAKAGQGLLAVQRGPWRLHKSQFDLFLPLHHMWLGYMSELHNLPPRSNARSTPNVSNMHAKLVKADFHGSLITVGQAKNPALIGLSGIVILETENAFRVITQRNQVKLLPKRNSIFKLFVPLHSTLPTTGQPLSSSTLTIAQTVLDIPHLEFELYGNQFCFRSSERAARKFKAKESIEL